MGVTDRHHLKIGYASTSGLLIGQGTLQESDPLVVLCSVGSNEVSASLLCQHNIVDIKKNYPGDVKALLFLKSRWHWPLCLP